MKKEYLVPQIECILDVGSLLLAGSVTGDVDGQPAIGYGGVDEGGQQDPDAKPFHMISVWDD